MTDKEKAAQEQVKEVAVDVRNEAVVQSANLYLLARKMLLVSLGAVALSVEEAQAFLDRLVERGEIAEADAQKLFQDFRRRVCKQQEKLEQAGRKSGARVENALEERIGDILKRLNVPSKDDIDELSRQIGELSRRIDALRAQRTDRSE